MRELFEKLRGTLDKGEAAVLVTVVASSGSTPRGAGARMLVTQSGENVGTIGGGAIEFRCQQLAKQVLTGQQGQLEHFILAPNDVADLGMICGGNAHVLFQYVPANHLMLNLCHEVLSLIAKKEPAWLVAELNRTVGLSVYSEKGWLGDEYGEIPQELIRKGQKQIEISGQNYFIEPLVNKGKVFVFGGGHVSQALVPVLGTLDFHCVVVEDRQEFLTVDLFPSASELITADLTDITSSLTIGADDYALVMTRGHLFDYILQEQLLQSPARYIGVMGSRRKIAVQIEKLQAAGFSKDQIQRITMPIGLAIKAETPAELAISIAGQLIMERAQDD